MRALAEHDLEWVWGELAHVVTQGRPLASAAGHLAEANARTSRGRAMAELGQSLGAGRALSDAVAELDALFPAGAGAALKAGEKSGRLAATLRAMADRARLDGRFRYSVLRALVYPLFIAVAGMAIAGFMYLRVRPLLLAMTGEFNMPSDVGAQVFLWLLMIEAIFLLFIPAAFLIVLYILPSSLVPVPGIMDALRIRFPFAGALLRKMLLARWCNTFSCLINAGVPEAEAVDLAGRSTGNRSVEKLSARARADLESGSRLSHAISRRRFFPATLVWLVGAAEERGGHADVWPMAEHSLRRRAESSAPVLDAGLRLFFGFLSLQIVLMTYAGLMRPLVQLMNRM